MNKFRTLLGKGRMPAQATMGLASPILAEMLGKLGFDSVLLDMQHGLMDYGDVCAMMASLSGTNATPMVRIPWNDPATIMKVLDAGAWGVVCPMVSTRAEAERFVAACRYPPDGVRSVGPIRAAIGNMLDYVATANREVMTIAMIETVEGFENLKEIVKTPGLDALFPGPGDLAMSYGEKPIVTYNDAKAVARLRHIVDVAHAAGVMVVLPGPDREMAEQAFRWGADWALMGTDWSWALAGATTALEATRAVVKEAAGAR